MKTPDELAQRLARQWHSADLREARLLDYGEAWPFSLNIPRPNPQAVQNKTSEVKAHLDQWHQVKVGEVKWQEINYRSIAEALSVPTQWTFRNPNEWVISTRDPVVQEEHRSLQKLLAETEPSFHRLFIRRRSLWKKVPLSEVIQASRLALAVQPGCAEGRPLRTLALEGIDTKFFERHEGLVLALLDSLHDGEASRQGLAGFLGAHVEGDHWLLVIALEDGLLPFRRQRISSLDLLTNELPGSHLIIIENEACQHHLPPLPGTIAVLGSGFDLNWTQAAWLRKKTVGYWGDLDTWGLEFLSQARQNCPHLSPLLMTEETFHAHAQKAVPEPTPANPAPSPNLTPSEQALYRTLLSQENGRLEQEFLPTELIQNELSAWRTDSTEKTSP